MKRTFALLPLAACTLLVGAAVAPIAAPPAIGRGSANNLADRLETARQKAELARTRVARFDRAASEAMRASDRALIAAAGLAAKVQEDEAKVAEAQAELAVTSARRRALDARLARERAPVTQLVAGLETLVRRPPLLTLLQPGSVEDAVHLRAVLSAVAPQVRAKTGGLRDDLADVRRLEAAAQRSAAAAMASQAKLEERRRELKALAAKQLEDARQATGSADREAERAYLAAQQARDIATLADRLATQPPLERSGRPAVFGAPQGYRAPVAGRMQAQSDLRTTAIFSADAGAQVVSPGDGRIAFAGPYRGYGRIVIVDHGEGWVSVVTGLGTTQVGVGQGVVAGSPIGRAPPSASPIGLELRHSGSAVDVLAALR